MRTHIKLFIGLLCLFLTSPLLVQSQNPNPNLIPAKASNFNIGQQANGYNNNNFTNVPGLVTDYLYTNQWNVIGQDDGVKHYAVGTNANWYHHGTYPTAVGGGPAGLFDMGDHTTGVGNYMIVNGAKDGSWRVWEYEVDVLPGLTYEFSAYVTCLFYTPGGTTPTNNYLPKMRLKVNGQNVGDAFTVPWTNGGNWVKWSPGNWTAGSNVTKAKLTIIDECTTDNGNDFGLDDIYFGLAQGYQLTATSFTYQHCICSKEPGMNYIDIDLFNPMGNNSVHGYYCQAPNASGTITYPVPDIELRDKNANWVTTNVNNHAQTQNGEAYCVVNQQNYHIVIRYFPNEGFWGNETLQFRVSKFNMQESAILTLQVRSIPSDPIPNFGPAELGDDGAYYLCLSNVSTFNSTASASWSANGNAPWPTGWEWSYSDDPNGTWVNPPLPTGQNNGLGLRYIRFYADNMCLNDCGRAYSDTYPLYVCAPPTISVVTTTAGVCTGASEPLNVTANYNSYTKCWKYKRNGVWSECFDEWGEMTAELQPGDKVKCWLYIDHCGTEPITHENEIPIISGPEFNTSIPVTFEEGYCPGSVVSLPPIQASWYNSLGITGITSSWYYFDPETNNYTQIAGNTVTLNNGTKWVTPGLNNSACGLSPYYPAFELHVYEEPAIEGLETLPDSLGPYCAGTNLNDILPALSPAGHYGDYSWEISSGSSQSGFSTNLPLALTAQHNGRWLRFHVQGCPQYPDAYSEPIKLWVGDKPSLNQESISVSGPVCAGQEPQEVFNVYVTNWNLFSNDTLQQWQVYYQNQWQPLTQFAIEYNGCPVRFVAHNDCGDHEPYPSVSSIQVTQGPEFAASFNYQNYLADHYCVENVPQTLNLPALNANDINAHGISGVTSFWEWSADGITYEPCTSLSLTEDKNGFLRCSLHSDFCGGNVPNADVFPLVIVGHPVVQSISVANASFVCEGEPLQTEFLMEEEDWHHGTPTVNTGWRFKPKDYNGPYVPLPANGIIESGAGQYWVNYYAENECYGDTCATPLLVTVHSAPIILEGVNTLPETLDACIDLNFLEVLPPTPVINDWGYADPMLSGWSLSTGTLQTGPYESVPDTVSFSHNGLWLRYHVEGCNGEDNVYVRLAVNDIPEVVYDIPSPLTLCAGNPLDLEVQSSTYPFEANWYRDGELFLMGPNGTTFQEGTYQLYYEVGNDCGISDLQGPYTLTVVQGPSFDYDPSWQNVVSACASTPLEEPEKPGLLNMGPEDQELGWFIRSFDGGNTNIVPWTFSTPVSEHFDGAELCYGIQSKCQDQPIYSLGKPIQVIGVPKVLSLPVFSNEGFCSGRPAELADPILELHGEPDPFGEWQIKMKDSVNWQSLPSTWNRELHDGALVRYHLVSNLCPDFESYSEELEIHVSAPPEFHGLPDTIMICSGSSLGIDPDQYIQWNQSGSVPQGGWQVSLDGEQGWGWMLEGHEFRPEAVDAYFDGKYLRYQAIGVCKTVNSDAILMNIVGYSQIAVSGLENVAVMNNFWPGKYYYYNTEQLVQGLQWVLTPELWPLHDTIIDGHNCCEITITSPGRATLKAVFGDGTCGMDEMIINATPFDVQEQAMPVMQLYPNPADQSVTIASEAIKAVNVYNLVGQKVKCLTGLENDEVVLPVADLTPAVYLVEVVTAKGIARNRLSIFH